MAHSFSNGAGEAETEIRAAHGGISLPVSGLGQWTLGAFRLMIHKRHQRPFALEHEELPEARQRRLPDAGMSAPKFHGALLRAQRFSALAIPDASRWLVARQKSGLSARGTSASCPGYHLIFSAHTDSVQS